MTKTQQHAMAVIRVRGGTVWVNESGVARCGLHHCSFDARTVLALAAQGHLVRGPGVPEAYRVKVPATQEKSR